MAGGRRGGGCALIAVLLLVGLGVGFFFGDAWARDRAEMEVATRLAQETGAEHVEATISGWPFLLSMVTGRVEQVDVVANQVPVELDGRTGNVSELTATAVGVTDYSNIETARAEQLDAVGTVDWAQLEAMTGLPLRHAGAGRVALDLTLQALGNSIDVVVEADLGIAPAGELQLTNPTVAVAGFEIPSEVVDAALAELSPQLKLPTLGGLSYTGLEITEAGIAASLSGTDVPIGELR